LAAIQGCWELSAAGWAGQALQSCSGVAKPESASGLHYSGELRGKSSMRLTDVALGADGHRGYSDSGF